MSANLENSAVATGLEKVSFHSNPQQEQCQKMFKLQYNWPHFTCLQGYAQNPSSQASVVCELRTSRYTSSIQKRQRNQRSKLPIFVASWRKQGNSRKVSNSDSLPKLKLLTACWLLSYVRLFAIPWTVSHQGFFRQEYWSGLPFPSPGDLPNPGIKPR